MPLYEFACGDCGAHFESIQSFSATTAPNCPVCQSSNVSRMLSRPAIHFKGSGWYITDSKKSGKQSANGSGRDGASERSASEAGSGENGAVEKASGDDGAPEKASSAKESAASSESKSGSGGEVSKAATSPAPV